MPQIHKLSSYERRTQAIENNTVAMEKLMSSVDDLVKAVQNNSNVEASAVTVIQGLAAKIGSATDDPRIQSLVSEINDNAAALSAAITASTPAAPEPNPAPTTAATAEVKA